MLWKSKRIFTPAAVFAAASLILLGCSGESREDKVKEAADAINAAIEHDLAMDRYEFTISKGALFDETNYDLDQTTYISVPGADTRDYYITTVSTDKEDNFTAEHLLLGDDHYYRLSDNKKNEYHIPSNAAESESGLPERLENGWVFDGESSSAGNEFYKKRLWIYGSRINPEDFAEASIDKNSRTTTITLSRSPEQLKESSLPSKIMYDEAMEYYQGELADGSLKPYEKSSVEAKISELEAAGAESTDRNYTSETLEAIIDSSGRLLSVGYRLTYEYGMEIDGETVEAITNYSYVSLTRANDESIVLPD